MAAKLERTKTPGVYKRGSRYVFRYRVGGVQRWESCRTLDEARRAKQARQTDIARGEFEERSRVTLHEYAREWVERHQGRGRRGFREGTRDEYRRQIESYVCTFFPERLKLSDVTPKRVAEFVGWLCKQTRPAPTTEEPERTVPLSDATVRNVMAALRSCLATAVREGVIRANPARDVDMPHRPTAESSEADEVKALKRDELAMLLAVIPERWRLFHWFLSATGLRISEAIALQWRHLQLDGSTPHVKVRRALVKGRIGPPKSKQGRRDVPLDSTLVSALREHHKDTEWSQTENPVFASANGSPLNPGNVFRRVLKPAAEEAGVPWAGFHTFRHTCASLLFAEGRNAKQVQRWLGHHSAAFTLSVYIDLLDDGVGEGLSIYGGAHKVQPSPTPSSTVTADLAGSNLALQQGFPTPTPLETTPVGDYDSAALTN